MPVIEIKQLVKKFGKLTALNGVDLTLDQGEVHAYLGPNGAGKTTTIRVLLGILRATSGSVSIFDRDAWKNSVELHKRLAFVPGEVNLWGNLTGGEVIDLMLALRKTGTSHTERREMFLERFELDPTMKCRAYSKGNRQKVALVAALASDAELYILDEPTSGLDPLMEKVFQDTILDLKKEGKSVLLSSHILSEVEALADKISIIKEGKIIQTGTRAEISQVAAGRTLEELFLSEYQGR
ncbi:MAG: ABC transporter ATP-binding protein [Coriobacteriales bacterium]|jgi:ABC-2 type transport system ATP-binding protein|nr:ABC transporter ATP-binding protein [Coriobacteriales bacterium]